MDNISPTDALSLFSRWQRENTSISVLCATPSFALSSKNGRVALCLDECLELSFSNDTGLRLFISEAVFSRVGPGDIPEESVDMIPEFEQCIHIGLPSHQMQCFLFASTTRTSN